jgi:hypothetical protein
MNDIMTWVLSILLMASELLPFIAVNSNGVIHWIALSLEGCVKACKQELELKTEGSVPEEETKTKLS